MDKDDTKRVSKVIIIYNSKLLLLLPKNKQKWHLPGGHIKKDETFIQGAKREVNEETNLTITSLVSIYRMNKFELFFSKTSTNNVMLSNEHKSFKWVSADEALNNMQITKETKRDLLEAVSKKMIKLPVKNTQPIKKKPQSDVDLDDKLDK